MRPGAPCPGPPRIGLSSWGGCLPVLETWDTTNADSVRRLRRLRFFARLRRLFCGCPMSPGFGDMGYHKRLFSPPPAPPSLFRQTPAPLLRVPHVSPFWRHGIPQTPFQSAACAAFAFSPDSGASSAGAPCLPVLETWDTTNAFSVRRLRRLRFFARLRRLFCGCPISPGFGDMGYHKRRFSPQPAPPSLFRQTPEPLLRVPHVSRFWRHGIPLTPIQSAAFAAFAFSPDSGASSAGAPCLPVLETWDTTKADSVRRLRRLRFFARLRRLFCGCPMSPGFGDMGYH